MSDVDTAVDGASVAPVETSDSLEQATAQTTTTEKVEPQEVEKARNEKGQFVPQDRFDQVTWARRQAERERDSERSRAAQLEQELQQVRTQRQPEQPQRSDAPTLEDYDFDLGKWSAAVAEHAESKARALVESEFSTREAQRNHQSVTENFASKSEQYAKDNPTYVADLTALDEVIQFPKETLELVYGLDNSPAVAHYIAKDFDLADRISRMSPINAALEIGRLEARLSAPKAKPVSNAPSPTPTIGGGAINPLKDESRMSDAEWLAAQSRKR